MCQTPPISTQPLSILQIGKGWFPEEPGGLNRYFYDCTQALPAAGVEVHSLIAGSLQAAQTSEGRVQAFAPAKGSLLERWRGARQAVVQQLQAAPVSLVVSHFGLYTFPVLNLLGNRPLVVHFHGPWAMESRAEGNRAIAFRLKKWLEQICYRQAVTFIVLSKAFQEILHQSYGVPLDKIHVVPGGVNPDRFYTNLSRQAAREQLGWQRDRPTILVVRRLAKRMGLENLIQAMVQVRRSYPEVQLKIVGKGSLQSALEQQIADLNLTDQVQLLGYIPDEQLPFMYRAADFSVVPTVSLEGFGLIVVESLAAGTPVLGTPIGGIPEILAPFSPDLVLAGTEPQHLAQGIEEALSGLRSLPSAEACQAYIQEHFAWSAIAQRLKSIYTAAAEEAPR